MEQSFFRQLLEALPAAVLVTDMYGNVVYANDPSLAVLASSTKLELPSIKDVLPEVMQLIAASENDPTESQSCRYTRPDGTSILIGFRVAPIIDGLPLSEGMHYAVIFQDVTEVEKLRDERDRLLQLAAVSEVLPAVLHELKNPLAAISTAVEVLIEEVNELSVQTELHAVLSEVRRIRLTLEGIGLVSHKMRNRKNSAIDFAIKEAFRILEAPMKQKHLVSQCVVPAMPLLRLDASAIRAIVFNLVVNAIYACSIGAQITLHAHYHAMRSTLEITVSDSGCGMSEAVLQRCRELFFTTKPNGSGLGLALCDAVIQSAGGQLEIRSTKGAGTTVKVFLPVARG
ncbi:MAG: ATP-binding protein [Acidobacteriota bacterium]